MFKNFMRKHFRKINEINEKYATPSLVMSRPVKVCLLLLRCYLLLLVGKSLGLQTKGRANFPEGNCPGTTGQSVCSWAISWAGG